MSTASGRHAPPAAAGAGWHLGYPLPPDADVHDELLAAPGETRPHWKSFAESLARLGPQELARRWDMARRLLRENGVTYNVYGDPRGTDRPWELDPLPLLLPPEEWRSLEEGLTQRARLLNVIVADLYGPQRLLRDGLLPPELVWAHPGFLRPCHGIPVPAACYLHTLAVDLARAPDGRWWALADRTQAPSGAGYALENRIVLSRALPELFRECRVQRLAGFFSALRDTLRAIAPRHRENPRIVLFTPGAYNETYFEHAYLARYLGYTLVEGADLTVRDQAVFLKTLGGLEPVDVILRRLDDDFCDPLVLRAESSLGVAGLVEAVRAGTVTVANALGSGLVETPALLPFLPGLCRTLLDADLAIPSVATWWCGQPRELEYVIEHLDELVVKPAFPGTGLEPVFGAHLDGAARDTLVTRLRRRPYAFVAQEQVALSTAPVWCGDRVEPRQIVLRTYLVAHEEGYLAMPGGLTRAASSRDSLVVSMQRGGGSKDTWVLSEGPVNPITLLRPAGAPVELSRGGAGLPSRVADNLFWLGRYVERAEATARLLRGILARLADASGEAPELPALAEALATQAKVEPTFVVADANGARSLSERGILGFIQEESPARTLRATLGAAQRLGAVVRDQISLDTWRVLNQLDQALPRGRMRLGAALEGLNRLVLTLAAFSGLGVESMTRGQGWRFADMGRRIERGGYLAGLLRGTLVGPHAALENLLEALLEVGDVSITYRRRYLGNLQLAPVLALLLLDESNPRSLAFQLTALDAHVRRLPRDESLPTRSPEEKLALAMLTRVRLLDVEDLCTPGPNATRGCLDGALRGFANDLAALSDDITRSYLSHAQASRQLGGSG
jgi:uncharacterized circularly permuted ATP-grasp superfamily protein/uncharacterized alpha-E superfamily protein